MLYKCSLFNIWLYTLNSLDTECFIVFYKENDVFWLFIYINIVYPDYGHGQWKSTTYKYTGGSAKVKASWSYRGKFQTSIFWLLINIFRQYFRGMYAKGCVLVVANVVGFRGAFKAN